MEGESRY